MQFKVKGNGVMSEEKAVSITQEKNLKLYDENGVYVTYISKKGAIDFGAITNYEVKKENESLQAQLAKTERKIKTLEEYIRANSEEGERDLVKIYQKNMKNFINSRNNP